jgi:hypothetical protein
VLSLFRTDVFSVLSKKTTVRNKDNNSTKQKQQYEKNCKAKNKEGTEQNNCTKQTRTIKKNQQYSPVVFLLSTVVVFVL